MATYTFQDGLNPPIDYIRWLVRDTNVSGGATTAIFSDEQIRAAYVIDAPVFFGPRGAVTASYTPSYRFVAATLLESLAGDISTLGSARFGGMIQALDIKIDNRGLAGEFRSAASALRAAEQNSGSFGIAEMVTNDFTWWERIYNQFARRA